MKAKYNPWLGYLSLPRKNVCAVVFDESTWWRAAKTVDENDKTLTAKTVDENDKTLTAKTVDENDKAAR